MFSLFWVGLIREAMSNKKWEGERQEQERERVTCSKGHAALRTQRISVSNWRKTKHIVSSHYACTFLSAQLLVFLEHAVQWLVSSNSIDTVFHKIMNPLLRFPVRLSIGYIYITLYDNITCHVLAYTVYHINFFCLSVFPAAMVQFPNWSKIILSITLTSPVFTCCLKVHFLPSIKRWGVGMQTINQLLINYQ